VFRIFRDREEIRRRLNELVQTFRQKGATSPEKAMTIQELGLPPRFEQAMHRRLGQTGIFVELNGKYYLNEQRLKEIQEQRSKTSGSETGRERNRGNPPSWFRTVGVLLMLPVGILFAIALVYIFIFGGVGYFPGELLIILLIVMLGVFLARLLFWRSRRRYWTERQNWN